MDHAGDDAGDAAGDDRWPMLARGQRLRQEEWVPRLDWSVPTIAGGKRSFEHCRFRDSRFGGVVGVVKG